MKFILTLCMATFLFSACRQDASSGQTATAPSDQANPAIFDSVPITPKISGRIEVLDVLYPAVRRKDESLDTACWVKDQELFLRFMAETNQDGRVFINDSLGKQVKMLHEGRIKPGFNEFAFNTEPLQYGRYSLFVTFEMFNDTIQRIGFIKHPISK